ncbi:hypothetical protein [Agaribacterium sp. ZY112]|uniref:hypothetical protein n=1 Tax=Agaribacterium sp. ZY112 TaxID=3233574 RepID=UPI0035251249
MDLMEPLYERALARQVLPSMGFVDQAAELLMQAKGIRKHVKQRLIKRLCNEPQRVLSWQWVDSELQYFFDEHPIAQVIEVGAGFSTRFHRLSFDSDWPQFSWLQIDSEAVVNTAKAMFPKTDNYHYLAHDFCALTWVPNLHFDKPAVVVVEDENLSEDLALSLYSCEQLLAATGHMHLIIKVSEGVCDALFKAFSGRIKLINRLRLCRSQEFNFKNLWSGVSGRNIKKTNLLHLELESKAGLE